jgi:selenocysteine-specific elongation factor
MSLTMERLLPIHVGLVGHIDHGKTELARALTQKVSTAGLDKHPQSQARGITIDLGFTMFVLDKYLVTLVDSPGHADLFRSVIAGAGIIDAALVVVAADEGPKVQTGEHLLLLESMGVDTIIVVITKIDIANDRQQALVEDRMKSIVGEMSFKKVEFVRVSALTGQGLDDLREMMLQTIVPRAREKEGSFLMPIDHAFSVKGHGTVVTGTILRGQLKTDDILELVPQGEKGKVRSIQTFSEPRSSASAGDRVGVNIPSLSDRVVSRGDYLCEPGSLSTTTGLNVMFQANPLYRGRLPKRMIVSATIGMPTVTAEIMPFEIVDGSKVVVDEIGSAESNVALMLQKEIAAEVGMKVVLMRTDLSPTQMRIIGSGQVIEVPESIILSKRKKRFGKVIRVRQNDVLVEGLASTKERAESIAGSSVRTAAGLKGHLAEPFGTRGVTTAVFDGPVTNGEEVIYERFVEEEYRFGHRT